MELSHADICRLLPHRDPFLLLRQASVESPGERGRGRVAISAAVPLFGALTGADLARESVLEGAAQLFGVTLASGREEGAAGQEGRHLLLGFDQVSFNAEPVPGELTLEVQLVQSLSNICRGQFTAHQNAVVVAAGFVTVLRG